MNFLKKIVCIFFIILSCVISSYAQENYSYTLSTTIEFTINTDNIIQNQNYNYYLNEIIPTMEKNKNDIESILLIGSASPEGNYNANIILANKRADKIYSYISRIVSKNKIIINNDYSFFLQKTGLDESDYTKLRATYVEIHFFKKNENINLPSKTDTIYIEKKDTVHYTTIENNYYIYQYDKKQNKKPILGIYNDIPFDLLLRANIGVELYFNKMSFFIEGSFSNWPIFGKTYNIDLWYTGFRKYFNYDYNKWFIGIYGNVGYFDTELFGDIGKVGFLYGGGLELGYTFSLNHHWKISPIIRIGLFERIYYANYYYTEQGNINISFNNYNNGKIDNTENIYYNKNNKLSIITIDKVITKDFFENSNKAYYIGPTFIGITIKKDFLIK